MKINFYNILDCRSLGGAVLGLGIAIHGSIEAAPENPDRCHYVRSDLPTEREFLDALKQGKDSAKLRGVSLNSWKAVVEPEMRKYPKPENETGIYVQNLRLYCALSKASKREVNLAIDRVQETCQHLSEHLEEGKGALSDFLESVQKLADYNVDCSDSIEKAEENFENGLNKKLNDPEFEKKIEKDMENYINAWLENKIKQSAEKEQELRKQAEQDPEKALEYEVFVTSDLFNSFNGGGYYTRSAFYEELVDMTERTARADDSSQKREAVKRFVNIGIGYARSRWGGLPPRRFYLPLLSAFSELGYTPQELKEMVILK